MIIDYNMTRDYCSDWNVIDAIREMVQNAIDSDKPYTCDILPETNLLTVVTKGVTLPMSVFAMGHSIKKPGSIGGYGEGFKLGMMILTRLGLEPTISTGKYFITGAFLEHEVTGLESFCLHFDRLECQTTSTTFACNLDGIDIDELKDKVTQFADNPLPKVDDVAILYTRPGKIYVNGLYVCEEEKLTFGYNFSPDRIKLNRDRNMVSGVEAQLGIYFAESGNAETLLTLIENEARDVSYLYLYLYKNPKLKAELARLFHNKYGEGATIGKPGTSYYGGTGGHISLGSTGYATMKACGVKPGAEVVDPDSPLGLLTTFVADNKKHMRSKAVQNCKTLLNQAKAWRSK